MPLADPLIERGLPANIEAEKSVLGAILLENSAYNAAAALLRAEDFSVDAHRRIYERMMGLMEGVPPRPIDYTTLTEELLQRKELEAVGGVSYLSALTDGLPRAANVEHYARIVKDKSVLRRLAYTAQGILQEAIDGGYADDGKPARPGQEPKLGGNVSEFLDRAESAILAVGEDRVRAGLTPLQEIFKSSYKSLDDLLTRGRRITGLETGFRRFDDLSCGLQPADLILVAARPSMGKTAWALNVAQFAALHGQTVGIFSLEMTKEALLVRMLCSEARVDAHKYRSGMLSREDLRSLADAMGRLAQTPMYIDDTAGINLYELRAKARRLKAERGLSLVIIDYLQLMTTPKAENRNQEISALSRGLKSLAKELQVPVLALSQLSRAPETRGNEHRPQLSDLRDSGSLEQDADMVCFLYREEYYLKMLGRQIPDDVQGRAELIVAKQRNGPTDRVFMAFLDKFSTFADIAQGYE
jgi:replicative DNA helicase